MGVSSVMDMYQFVSPELLRNGPLDLEKEKYKHPKYATKYMAQERHGFARTRFIFKC